MGHRPVFLALLGAAALLPACQLSFGYRCNVSEPRSGHEALDGITRVEFDVGAGWLHVSGDDLAGELSWTGNACASSREDLAEVRLESHRDGDVLRLVMVAPDDGRPYGLDLDVVLPDSLALVIRDGSGELTVEHVAALDVDDGSGDLSIQHVSGDVRVEDGSGNLEIHDVGGVVSLVDGSGDIELRRVGSVSRLVDSSGSIDVQHVSGDVHIDEDGSGDMRIGSVTGSVTVLVDGSGQIDIGGVEGSVSIVEDGSGDIVVAGVGGDLSVGEGGSGSVRHSDVVGQVQIRNS